MNSTVLGAKKEKTSFISEVHKKSVALALVVMPKLKRNMESKV